MATECDFDKAIPSLAHGDYFPRRERELRLSLYRAVYAGDLEEAENITNLLAMVDIDRDLIWQAKGMERG